MRPRTLEEFVGQHTCSAPGGCCATCSHGGRVESLILWGPPGSGKTTLAHLLGAASGAPTRSHFSAVLQGVKELREIVDEAEARAAPRAGAPRSLFVDEIHRFNKAQQDAFLPHVEAGTIILIGATTENPSFEVIAPLLSRTRVLVLEPLARRRRRRARRPRARATASAASARDGSPSTPDGARLPRRAARTATPASRSARSRSPARLARAARTRTLDLALVEEAAQQRALRYDKAGEEHYNVISAFIKSLRGSDPDAAVYWLMRMLEAGEDPLFVARRMVIFAAEDVGNAEPQALPGRRRRQGRRALRRPARGPHPARAGRDVPRHLPQVERGLSGHARGGRRRAASAARCPSRSTCATRRRRS